MSKTTLREAIRLLGLEKYDSVYICYEHGDIFALDLSVQDIFRQYDVDSTYVKRIYDSHFKYSPPEECWEIVLEPETNAVVNNGMSFINKVEMLNEIKEHKMEKSDFKVGQIVYLRIIKGSNAARRLSHTDKDLSDINSYIIETTVTNVGRKYIMTDGGIKFDATDEFRQVYTYGGVEYQLFLSKQDIYDTVEKEVICELLRSKFGLYCRCEKEYTLEQLQAVKDILKL